MKSHSSIISRFFIGLVMVIGLNFAPDHLWAAQISDSNQDEEIQVLATGPIHEAFAEAVIADPEPGLIVSMEPPIQIEEVPPDQKPEGDVQWIPGYWAWDDDKGDYIWISGIWRVTPPDRQWIPGYWNPVPNGYQWISGYWADNEEKEVTYLPEPPESVEAGPNTEAPSPSYVWIPGCWVWYNGRYAWRPGYWELAHEDWLWIPAHYSWTPRGYIFIGGYWDYTVVHRGILFAPVFFPVHWRLGVVHHFSPFFTVNLTIFDDVLFLRPIYRHYYFGDYYDARYYRRGILPWFSPHARRMVHDPIYRHQRWLHRNDHRWQQRLENDFQSRRANVSQRPPRVYDRAAVTNPNMRQSNAGRSNYVMPLGHAGSIPGDKYRFQPLSDNDRSRFIQREREIGSYRQERQHRENTAPENRRGVPEQNNRLDRENYDRSPIRSNRGENNSSDRTPPARVREPGPNTNVEPLERQYTRPQSRSRSINDDSDRSGAGNSNRQPTRNSISRGQRDHLR